MDNKEEWATPTLKECPWWRDGMTPEEYDVEREYCYKNFDTPEKMIQYIPLWKQNKKD